MPGSRLRDTGCPCPGVLAGPLQDQAGETGHPGGRLKDACELGLLCGSLKPAHGFLLIRLCFCPSLKWRHKVFAK